MAGRARLPHSSSASSSIKRAQSVEVQMVPQIASDCCWVEIAPFGGHLLKTSSLDLPLDVPPRVTGLSPSTRCTREEASSLARSRPNII